MVSHSTYSLRFFRERKWHTVPWTEHQSCFDESNFFLYGATTHALPYFEIKELNKEYSPLSDFEKFFIYISPYYLRYFLESACIRRDFARLVWLMSTVQNNIGNWKNQLKGFLKKYEINIPKEWMKNHPLNSNKVLSNEVERIINRIGVVF